MLRKSVKVALCAVPILMFAGSANGQSIVNGSFEVPANPPAPGNFLTIGPGAEATNGFTGWTITTGNIDVVDATAAVLGINWGAQAAIDGGQILDLNGTTSGGIAQNFVTTAGQQYQVTFSFANNPLGGGGESATLELKDVGTNASLSTFPFLHTNSTLTSPNWLTQSVVFSATGTSTRLSFTSTSGVGDASGGVLLDAISISSVPEPSSLLLTIIAGIAVHCGLIRRTVRTRCALPASSGQRSRNPAVGAILAD